MRFKILFCAYRLRFFDLHTSGGRSTQESRTEQLTPDFQSVGRNVVLFCHTLVSFSNVMQHPPGSWRASRNRFLPAPVLLNKLPLGPPPFKWRIRMSAAHINPSGVNAAFQCLAVSFFNKTPKVARGPDLIFPSGNPRENLSDFDVSDFSYLSFCACRTSGAEPIRKRRAI